MVIWSMFWMRMEMLLDNKSRMMKPINGLLVKIRIVFGIMRELESGKKMNVKKLRFMGVNLVILNMSTKTETVS